MPKRKHTEMQKLTPEQQQELIERYHTRKDVREANAQLAALVLDWITDAELTIQEFMERFNAGGHFGEYHEWPQDTTFRRITQQLAKISNLAKRMADTPLDYMGAVELSYAYERIKKMIALLENSAGGTMQDAITLYKSIGEGIRQKVYDEMGHYPEAFPTPRGRITGEEPEHQFRPTDYQPPLLGGE